MIIIVLHVNYIVLSLSVKRRSTCIQLYGSAHLYPRCVLKELANKIMTIQQVLVYYAMKFQYQN